MLSWSYLLLLSSCPHKPQIQWSYSRQYLQLSCSIPSSVNFDARNPFYFQSHHPRGLPLENVVLFYLHTTITPDNWNMSHGLCNVPNKCSRETSVVQLDGTAEVVSNFCTCLYVCLWYMNAHNWRVKIIERVGIIIGSRKTSFLKTWVIILYFSIILFPLWKKKVSEFYRLRKNIGRQILIYRSLMDTMQRVTLIWVLLLTFMLLDNLLESAKQFIVPAFESITHIVECVESLHVMNNSVGFLVWEIAPWWSCSIFVYNFCCQKMTLNFIGHFSKLPVSISLYDFYYCMAIKIEPIKYLRYKSRRTQKYLRRFFFFNNLHFISKDHETQHSHVARKGRLLEFFSIRYIR